MDFLAEQKTSIQVNQQLTISVSVNEHVGSLFSKFEGGLVELLSSNVVPASLDRAATCPKMLTFMKRSGLHIHMWSFNWLFTNTYLNGKC